MHIPLVISQSVTVELEVVVDSFHRHQERVEACGKSHVIQDGAHVVLDVVDLLLVLVDDLVSVEDHVTPEESRQTSREPNTEKPIECLQTFWIKIVPNSQDYFDTLMIMTNVETRPR